MSDSDITHYIRLCQLVGSYLELVQGSGGNISVKDSSFLCVKSSGRMLAETTEEYGYSVCHIHDVESKYKNEDTYLKDISCGGEEGSTPSMETFFHLLPSKWVVHLHPTFLLTKLCHPNWRSVQTKYTHRHIPYYTPGLELAHAIRSQYQGEKVLFLKSHGLILCSDSVEEVCEMLDTIYHEQTNKYLGLQTAWNVFNHATRLHNIHRDSKPLVMRHCNHIKNFHERFFLPITPDITLFLKQFALAQETVKEDPVKLLDDYYVTFYELPAVLKLQDSVFIFGQSHKHCICIEEVLESYIQITSATNAGDLVLFESADTKALKTMPQETHRLQIL